jgi:uncharacterized protein (TIGR00725 family)
MVIGVIGSGDPRSSQNEAAMEVGRLVAESGARLVCGGMSGMMEASCRGARAAGGTTIGILPTDRSADANPFVDIAIPTGMGIGRNILVVRAADALVAMPGSHGTMSEIALALNLGKPVVDLGNWGIDGTVEAKDPVQAVKLATELAAGR